MVNAQNKQSKSTGLGTFGGVYVPSILTILGVIMYLRFGWVVGNVGLLGTFAIVTLATAITFLTSLSICAIATDRVVRVGGAYHMISRSLGIETGGAVGISLYFAQTLSTALYTLGFTESVVNNFTFLEPYKLYIALVITALVGVLAMTSADLAIKTQYLIMAVIAVSLVSFALGHPLEESSIELWGVPQDKSVPFWQVFAVFFPAVTGIMAGVNMSGDLRDPVKSIPKGTLAAVITGYVIYMLMPLGLALRADASTLVSDPLVLFKVSLWQPAILFGVWGATLSSALGSILGAPRVLQALARDGVLPPVFNFLGVGSGPEDEPRRGTVVTLGVAIAAVCVGELDLIAPILTMFFLTTYLVLNVSAGIEGVLQSPSFRPTFRVHWSLSLLGALGCLGVMVLINAIATMVAGAIVLLIYLWLQRREITTTWGDVRRGIWKALISKSIYQIEHQQDDPKNWRPHLLVLSGAPRKHWSLIEVADAISHNRALMTVATVLPKGSRDSTQQTKLEKTLLDYLEKRNVRALVKVLTASESFRGAIQLVKTYGLGPLQPNTILLGENKNREKIADYCRLITKIHREQRNVLVLKENRERGFGDRRRIDIWWGGMQDNGGLMLLVAYLMRTDLHWRQADIVLKLVVPDQGAAQAAKHNLNDLIASLRINVRSQMLIADGRSFTEILHQSSANADLIFLGMARPETQEDYQRYYDQLQQRVANLPAIIFVLAAPNFAFGKVLQDTGNA